MIVMLNICFSMTTEAIQKHCKECKLYLTPHLNDVLYLHYKGIPNLTTFNISMHQ